MNKEYYKEYYELERKHWWFVERAAILMGLIEKRIAPKGGDLKILNAGGATGRTGELLEQFGQVTDMEYDADCRKFTEEMTGKRLEAGDLTKLTYPDNSFDIVCAFDVIEHIEDDALAVSEMMRVCKPGGRIFVTVPAYMTLWGEHDVVNMHYRRYVMKGLKAVFSNQAQKGKIMYSTYFNVFLFQPIAAFRILSRLLPKKKVRKEGETGSDFSVKGQDSFVSKLLGFVFGLERVWLLGARSRFPFWGVSAALIWEKANDK